MKIEIKNQYYFWQDSYFDKRIKKRRRRRKSLKIYMLFVSFLFVLFIFNDLFLLRANCQDELEFDLNEPPTTTIRTTKSGRSRTKTRSTAGSVTSSSTSSTTSTTTSKIPQLTLAPKITQPNLLLQTTTVGHGGGGHGHGGGLHTTTAPYHYATETLNKTHANLFKNWLDVKSTELYEMSVNYSGFKLLNETYNLQLREDAKFSWINFTEMIMEISNTISEVLYNKTLIVKNLSDQVEDAFDKFRNDSRRIKESANHVYYDTKSPNTFCDVAEALRLRAAKHANLTATPEPVTKFETFTTMTSTPPLFLSSSSASSNLDSLSSSSASKLADDSLESTTANLNTLSNITNFKMLFKKSDLIVDDDIDYQSNSDFESLEFDLFDNSESKQVGIFSYFKF